MTRFGNTWLSGTYTYDDEGEKAQRVALIQDGVLKTFLMSRLPIASFALPTATAARRPAACPPAARET